MSNEMLELECPHCFKSETHPAGITEHECPHCGETFPHPTDEPDTSIGPRIANVSIDDLEEKLAVSLLRSASQGITPAAALLLKVAEMSLARQQAQVHAEEFREAQDDPVRLCAFLARFGLKPSEVETDHLGRDMTKKERESYRTAQSARLLEARAIGLGRARLGLGEIPEWAMQRWKVKP
jgi:hypothetical protein